jgi:hypothetical protein
MPEEEREYALDSRERDENVLVVERLGEIVHGVKEGVSE